MVNCNCMCYSYLLHNLIDYIYTFFNNATVAAVLAVLIASIFARSAYRKQKVDDKFFEIKDRLINDIMNIQEKIDTSLLVIDQIANSYKITTKDDIDFFKETVEKISIPKLSELINEEIPSLRIKIMSKINLYFDNNDKIEKQCESFFTEIKKWHDPIAAMEIDLKQRVEKQEKLSNKKIVEEGKKIIKIISKEKILIYS